MAVLTWQNVDGPRTGYGAPSIDSALSAINNGFNALQGTAKMYRDDSAANFDNAKNQNTGALINSLANINSIGDLDKHVASGAFNADALKSQFGGAVDYKALNDALMARRGQIQADSENQLKLNEDTAYQEKQPLLSQLTSLANTDPAAYNQALKSADLGAAAGRIIGAVNPAMNDTRQNATTQRGQDLSHSAQMAGIAVDRARLAYQQQRDAKTDYDDEYAVGQKYGADNAGKYSGNDLLKSFVNTDAYKKMTPAEQESAVKGLGSGASNATMLTDEQKKAAALVTTPLDNTAKQLDDTLATAKSNFARTSPAFQVLRGAAPLANLNQGQLIDSLSKELDYNDKGELADMITRTASKYNVDIATVASAAQNLKQSSSFRIWGAGREGVKLDMDSLDKAVGKLRDYASSGQATEDTNSWNRLTAPATQLKQQSEELKSQLSRQIATGQDTTQTRALIGQLNNALLKQYQDVLPTANTVRAAADNRIPAGATGSYTAGMVNWANSLQR